MWRPTPQFSRQAEQSRPGPKVFGALGETLETTQTELAAEMPWDRAGMTQI